MKFPLPANFIAKSRAHTMVEYREEARAWFWSDGERVSKFFTEYVEKAYKVYKVQSREKERLAKAANKTSVPREHKGKVTIGFNPFAMGLLKK